jgi:hypothetical protein
MTKSVRLVFLAAFVLSIAVNVFLYFRYIKTERVYQTQSAPLDEMVVIRTKGGLLQVSTIKSPEQFGSTLPHNILGFDLGPTTTQIRVPATIHYQIKLDADWRAEIRGKQFIVVAPAVIPSLPVAIETGKIEKFASGRWTFLTGTSELDSLERTITADLAKRAIRPSYINFQRDSARQTVREFVKKWLLTQEKWKEAAGYRITVLFADEQIESIDKIYPHDTAAVQ